MVRKQICISISDDALEALNILKEDVEFNLSRFIQKALITKVTNNVRKAID